MAENTKIEWADHTWNPWIGCTKVGPACDFCYAEELMDTRYGKARWGAGEDRVHTSASTWAQPLKWDRAAAAAGRIDRVFCLSLGDIWDNEVDDMWRRRAFEVMERTPNLIYLLLSKRIGNAVKMCDVGAGNPILPRNAVLGATMVTQDEWDRDMPKLQHAAEILAPRFSFASVEPMLSAIKARGDLPDWVIVGGESGRNARPMHPDWARSLRDQCTAVGVPFFFKQWGEWKNGSDFASDAKAVTLDGRVLDPTHDAMHAADREERVRNATMMRRVGKRRAGRELDGRTWDEMPAVRR